MGEEDKKAQDQKTSGSDDSKRTTAGDDQKKTVDLGAWSPVITELVSKGFKPEDVKALQGKNQQLTERIKILEPLKQVEDKVKSSGYKDLNDFTVKVNQHFQTLKKKNESMKRQLEEEGIEVVDRDEDDAGKTGRRTSEEDTPIMRTVLTATMENKIAIDRQRFEKTHADVPTEMLDQVEARAREILENEPQSVPAGRNIVTYAYSRLAAEDPDFVTGIKAAAIKEEEDRKKKVGQDNSAANNIPSGAPAEMVKQLQEIV